MIDLPAAARPTILALGAALALSTPAVAGDLQREVVPAEARWVVHVDFDGFRGTQLFRALREAKGLDFDVQMEEVVQQLGFDPLQEIHGLTVFGTSATPEAGVAVLDAGARADALLTMLVAQENHRSFTRDGKRLHAWSETANWDDAIYLYVAGEADSPRRRVVLSRDEDQLVHALATLDGRAQNLSQAREPRLTARPKPGSFFYVEARGEIPGLSAIDPASSVAEMARDLSIDVGESEGWMRVHATVGTDNAEDARNIAMVIQGGLALAQLASNQEPELARLTELASALQVRSQDRSVSLEFEYESLGLLELLRSLEDGGGEHFR